MRKIRYLVLLILGLVYGLAAVAQDDYNPSSPNEPGVQPQKLILLVSPAEAGFASGGGTVMPWTAKTVTAYQYANWTFVNWTDEDGNVLSTDRDYQFIKQNRTEMLTANFEYTPGSPAEPVPATQILFYNLTVQASDGGTVHNDNGRYQSGAGIYLSAYTDTNAGYRFVAWVDNEGQTVSTVSAFWYTKKACNETLTALFEFAPGEPGEPGRPIVSHYVKTCATEGGTASASNAKPQEGSIVRLTARPDPGYEFTGWYVGDGLFSDVTPFDYTMGAKSVSFEARFDYNPVSPGEPAMATDKQYAIYLLSPITYPGKGVECPVYLTNLSPLGDIQFNLTFPESMTPDFGGIMLRTAMDGYTLSYEAVAGETNAYTLHLTGGTVKAGNKEIFRVPLYVPETIESNGFYPVIINKVSVTQEDGTTCTASTRNGRVSVYKRGDTNGDGEVNILDRINLVGVIGTGAVNEGEFIQEVSDINDDGEFSILDVIGISDIIANE